MLNRRLYLVVSLAVFATALNASSVEVSHRDERIGSGDHRARKARVSTIVFSSDRLGDLDIYVMDVDENGIPIVDENGMPLEPRQLTGPAVDDFPAGNDSLPALSPDGKGRIVFESNRNRVAGEPVNQADLYWMKADGEDLTKLTRGSAAAWSPNGKYIAYHRSQTGSVCPPAPRPPGIIPGCPIKFPDPGAATYDSDIFVLNVKAFLDDDCHDDTGDDPGDASSDDDDCDDANPRNITNTDGFIEDDPDWSPDGRKIAFTRHPDTGPHLDSNTAEIHALNLRKGTEEQLTNNNEEERAAAWSPDGKRIAYMCRKGDPISPMTLRPTTFEICVMDLKHRDPSGFPVVKRLTSNSVFEGGPHWSPDGKKIVFGRTEAGVQQLWVMDLENLDGLGFPAETRLTFGTDTKLFATWGEESGAATAAEEDVIVEHSVLRG